MHLHGLFFQLVEFLLFLIRDDYLSAFCQKGLTHRPSQPACATSYYYDFVFECHFTPAFDKA